MGLDSATEQVTDATTLLHFRHLLEKHHLGEAMFAALNRLFDANRWIMRGGGIVDATIIAAPSWTKNATGIRDPEMHQTGKGNQWYFQMLAHTGVDAGTGYVHSVSVTGANVHDLDQITNPVRHDDQVVCATPAIRASKSVPTSSPTSIPPGSSGGSLPVEVSSERCSSTTGKPSPVRRRSGRRTSIGTWF